MNTDPGPAGTLEVALAHAKELLARQPALAAEQAREILKVVPEHPPALFLLASALARSGRGDEAIAALRQTVERDPAHPEAWRLLAEHLYATGDSAGADAAYARHIRASTRHPVLQRAALAMVRNDIPVAESLLKSHLMKAPTDVPAIRMLAEVAMRIGRDVDAKNLLERCTRARAGLRARTLPARSAPAPAERRRGRPRRGRAPARRGSTQSGLPQSRGRDPEPRRRVRALEPDVRGPPQGVPDERQGLAQLRPRAEDRGTAGREHRGLPPLHRPRSRLRRGVLEPRQPQDVPLHRDRPRGDARAASRTPRSTRRTACTCTSPLARRTRTRATTRSPSSTMQKAMRCTARATATTPT